jgi:hypothetical protein
MIPAGPRPVDRRATSEPLSTAMGTLASRTITERLEQILIDDRELLISLQCQLEQIRREIRLLNDDRIARALDGEERPISN